MVRAIREGIWPDGSLIGPPMPIEFYRGMSDDDARALAAYLRAQPPVRNVVPKSEYRIPLPPSYGPPIKAAVVAPPRNDRVRYGAYLAGPLGPLHGLPYTLDRNQRRQDAAGRRRQPVQGRRGVSVSRNLTPTGLKDWSDAEIARAIREGKSRDGSALKPPMAFGWYLQHQRRRHEVADRLPSLAEAAAAGWTAGRREEVRQRRGEPIDGPTRRAEPSRSAAAHERLGGPDLSDQVGDDILDFLCAQRRSAVAGRQVLDALLW